VQRIPRGSKVERERAAELFVEGRFDRQRGAGRRGWFEGGSLRARLERMIDSLEGRKDGGRQKGALYRLEEERRRRGRILKRLCLGRWGKGPRSGAPRTEVGCGAGPGRAGSDQVGLRARSHDSTFVRSCVRTKARSNQGSIESKGVRTKARSNRREFEATSMRCSNLVRCRRVA
jgi:hypothetical protein